EKSAQLYLMAFPTNNKQKDVSFMVLDLGAGKGNNLLLNNKIKYLKENFSLTEDEKVKLLLLEEKINQNNFVIDNYYLNYNKNNLKLNTAIKRIIERKTTATNEELGFLEKFYGDVEDPELASTLGNLYIKNGDINKGNYYNSLASENGITLNSNTPSQDVLDTSTPIVPTIETTIPVINKNLSNGRDALNRKSYNEALIFFNKAITNTKENDLDNILFYRGKTYFLMGNYDKAISDFNNIKSVNENSSELYYYLGVINHKQGNIDKAKEYLRKSRENNPSSTWGRKSSIYLLKL
ncbi:tetratricopeptide repeat protein, partial [uncultured Cetobacterium sp.]